MKRAKWVLGMLTGCLMIMGMTMTAFADSSVRLVTMTVDAAIQDGDDVNDLSYGYKEDGDSSIMVAETSKYDIESVKWTNAPSRGYWTMGTVPKVRVVLYAKDDYYFSGSYNSDRVDVKGATFVNASHSGRYRLTVNLELRMVSGQLEIPEDVYWTSRRGQAEWDSVKYADAYEVRLMRNNTLIKRLDDITNNRVNLYQYMTRSGTYSFQVRAIGKSGSKVQSSDWEWSDDLEISSSEVYDGTNLVGTDTGGSPGTPGTPHNGPLNPQLQFGWIQTGGYWYFKNPDGTYLTGTPSLINDSWYRFDASGRMITGWFKENDKYFYFNPVSGALSFGWVLDPQNNKWYYLGDGGVMSTGWLSYNNQMYYLTADGSMAENWLEIDGNWYYFYPGQGHKAVNTWITSGIYVDGNGVWVR